MPDREAGDRAGGPTAIQGRMNVRAVSAYHYPRPPLSDMFRRSATSWCIVAGDVAVLAGCWRLGRRKVLLVARNR
jgi:hypothetical protein